MTVGGGVVLWDAAVYHRLEGAPLTFAERGSGFSHVAFSPDGKTIAAQYTLMTIGGNIPKYDGALLCCGTP